jgi:hypothetical protein
MVRAALGNSRPRDVAESPGTTAFPATHTATGVVPPRHNR